MTEVSQTERQTLINQLRQFPDEFEAVVSPLSAADLTFESLPGEWTVAQIVHHLADAHMNAYVRFKLVLTEEYPTFKSYEQVDWAKTPEAVGTNVEDSLAILRGLHHRWAMLMDTLTNEQWGRRGLHPDLGEITLQGLLEGYVRHSRNHLDQIAKTLEATAAKKLSE